MNHHHPRRRRAAAGAVESVASTARARVGRVGMEAGDFAAEVSEVVLADRELEHFVDARDEVSQRANGAPRR